MVGIVAVIISAGYVFNENLYAYGLCSTPPNTRCSDAPWFSSMSLSFSGGIAAVSVGAFLGLRSTEMAVTACGSRSLHSERWLR